MGTTMPEPGAPSIVLRRLLVLLCLLVAPAVSAASAEYRLAVAFDLPGGRVLGEAEIMPVRPARMTIPRGDLVWKAVEVDGKAISLPQADQGTLNLSVHRRVRIRYEATFPLEGAEQISPSGIVLSGEWYPVVPGTFRYRLTAQLPAGWEAVSEADRIRRRVLAGGMEFRFDFPHRLPHAEGISLVASDRFVVKRGRYRDIDLYAYFLPEDAAHAERFLAKAAEYLQRFERLLGPYPYRRFSMVEHAPAGAHSLAGYIVLGRDEIRAERWEDTALDHEIAHQWFGNSVFTDYSSGNWNEGLALYVADYLSAEAAGEGWKCRRRMLAGYGNNISRGKAYPLAKFEEKGDRASKFIGYAKAGMVFHMLRRELGDARFFAGLKRFVAENRFRVASWKEVERAFAPQDDPSLAPFFAQWLQRADMPMLTLSGVRAVAVAEGFELEFTLGQSTPPYRLNVPINIRFADGSSARQTIRLGKAALTVRKPFAVRPVEVVVDEGFDLFRTLAEAEYPPTIERLLTRETIGIVADAQGTGLYAPLVESLAGLQGRVMKRQIGDTASRFAGPEFFGGRGRQQPAHRPWQALNPAAMADESAARPDAIIVLGNDNPAAARLFPENVSPQADFVVHVASHPHDPRRLVALVHADSEEAVRAAVQALPNLWCLTVVAMKSGRAIVREEADVPRGLRAKVL
ncbi:M1 family metallopeptidase [Sulfurimicrobium lacus]|nr:M1 family aminopeptidase [Sulfurimicrobium lacus]